MADVQLTPQQAQAVTNRGGSLLVSAAAGSGKTKVLVERVFSYLAEEHCHIDDFLIITFTRAAAAELRSKLASELAKRVAQSPEDEHLRRQMFRVYQADIKTVDGFCASLLREHVHLLEPVEGHSLTPDFRILDESEASLLKEKALEQALESFYQRIEQGDGGCASLAATLGFGRDDRALAALSAAQCEDGGFASWGAENAESTAQVVMALCALGIDPAADERFCKEGGSAVSALLGFRLEEGSFAHVGGTSDAMASEQGLQALEALRRFYAGEDRFFDMTDAGTPVQWTADSAAAEEKAGVPAAVYMAAGAVVVIAAGIMIVRKGRGSHE